MNLKFKLSISYNPDESFKPKYSEEMQSTNLSLLLLALNHHVLAIQKMIDEEERKKIQRDLNDDDIPF